MSEVQVTIKDNSRQLLAEFDKNAAVTLEALGIQTVGYAALELENDPRRIDTGLLRNSLAYAIAGDTPVVGSTGAQTYKNDGHDKNGNPVPIETGIYSAKMPKSANEKAVYIGTNVEYGPYVHEGFELPNGKEVQPNRYLRNAVTKHEKEINKIIKAGLKGEL